MVAQSPSTQPPVQQSSTSSTSSSSSSNKVQRKPDLRGMGYQAQAAALAPRDSGGGNVQARSDVQASPSAALPQASGGGAGVQRRVQRQEGAGGGGAGGGGGYVKPEIEEDGGNNKWSPGDAGANYKSIDVKGTKPEDTLGSEQFKLFAKRVQKLLEGIGSAADPMGVATEIWLAAMGAMSQTQQDYENAPLVAGSSYEKQMSAKAYQDLLPKFDALVSKINGAFSAANVQNAKSWGFWSGEGAKDAAGANCESSLEGGYIGSIFDAINITGGWDIQMWGALSRAYAQAAVENVEGREFHIFVGSGKTGTEPLTTENIWAQVESKVVYAAAKRNPNMTMSVHAVTNPANKTTPDVGGKGCNWVSDPVRPVGVEPMRNVARGKANATVPTKKTT